MASSNNKISLVFIVNGNPVPFEANVNEPLHAVLGAVLLAAGVVGDNNKDDWAFKVGNDTLDANKKISELGLKDGTKISLHSKVGVVG